VTKSMEDSVKLKSAGIDKLLPQTL
jgi:hypothetical protein